MDVGDARAELVVVDVAAGEGGRQVGGQPLGVLGLAVVSGGGGQEGGGEDEELHV